MATASDPIPRLIAFQTVAAQQVPDARVLAFEAVAARKGRLVEQVRNWRRQLDESALGGGPSRRRRVARDPRVPDIADRCARLSGSQTGAGRNVQSQRNGSRRALRASAERPAIALDDRDRHEGRRGDRRPGAARRSSGGGAESRNGRVSGRPARPSVDNLRGQLADDEALVEFVAFDEGTPSGAGPVSRRYGAFVLTRSALGWTDLGPAQPLSTSRFPICSTPHTTGRCRSRTTRTGRRRRRTRPHTARCRICRRAVASDQAVARRRAERPASSHRAGRGARSRAVRGAVRGRDLIDRFAISYVPASRDPPDPLVSGLVSRAGRGCQSWSGARQPRARSDRARHCAGRRWRVSRLRPANLGCEAAGLRRSRVTGSAATERTSRISRAPSLLHIVGHGIVRRGDDCQGGPCVSASLDASTQAMSLAAIVLEEAYGRGAGSPEDGMLAGTGAGEPESARHGNARPVAMPDGQRHAVGRRRRLWHAPSRRNRRGSTIVAPVERRGQRPAPADAALLRRPRRRRDAGGRVQHAKLAVRRVAGTPVLSWAPVILSGSPGRPPPSLFAR